MTRLAAAASLLAVVLVGCGSIPVPPESPSAPVTSTDYPSASPVPTVEPLPVPQPGQPYDAGAILDAMRQSRRPGGVPDGLQTEPVARAVADAIWTFDGRPWSTMSVGGSCGSQRCTLEVAGAGPDAAGDDVWAFAVDPSTGAVDLVAADLHGLPATLVDQLDRMARSVERSGLLDNLLLASARWLPPPDEDRFVLSYRAGGMEGSCARDVTLDASRNEVVEMSSTDC